MEIRKYLLIGLLLFCSCEKELKTADIISNLKANPKSVDADGSSVISVSVALTDKSASDKRNIVFTTSSGSWVGSKTDTLIVPASFANGQIIANASLTAPSSPGAITITAASQSLTINGDYTLSTSIIANNVAPASIKLEPSALGIGSYFTSEVTLTGKISGSSGNNASKGVKVVFEDFLSSGLPANGHFRQQQLTSDGSSNVSAIYGAPGLPIGTPISIVVTVLDAQENKTNISSTIILTINK